MKRLGSRFANWSENWLHHRANELVAHANDVGVDGIVFEILTDIRDRISNEKTFQQWAFAEYQCLVAYKAREAGLWVDCVPAAYTSKECSRCGYVADRNRSDKAFGCVACNREVHADYDAAVMVGKKYGRLRSGRTRRDGGAACQLALKSGTLPLTADQGAVQAVTWDAAAATDKSRASTSEPQGGRAK